MKKFLIILIFIYSIGHGNDMNPIDLKDILREVSKVKKETSEMISYFDIERSERGNESKRLDYQIANLEAKVKLEEKRLSEEEKLYLDVLARLKKSEEAEKVFVECIVKNDFEKRIGKRFSDEELKQYFLKDSHWKDLSREIGYCELARLFIKRYEGLLETSNEIACDKYNGKDFVRIGIYKVIKSEAKDFDIIRDMVLRKRAFEVVKIKFDEGDILK